MTTTRHTLTRLRAGLLAVAGVCASLAASAWEPSKPIEFVVPAGTGGGADQMARFIAQLATGKQLLRQPIKEIFPSAGGWSGAACSRSCREVAPASTPVTRGISMSAGWP